MQIFLSYAKEDEEFAANLARDLQARGANVWFDLTDVAEDDQADWERSVEDALGRSDVLLVLYSPAALTHPYIENDWRKFWEEGRPVVVAVAERCDVPERLRQRVDFTGHYDQALHRLQLLLIEEAARLSSSKWHQPPQDEN